MEGRRRPFARALFAVIALLGLAGFAAHAIEAADASLDVVVLPTTGIVDNVMAGYLREGIAQAANEGAAAVVIQLNTPGGSLEATNDIVGVILEARVPVIVWVAPAGGHAASAGTFITLAGNLALMAPGTSIGAASPVSSTGADIPDTERSKVFSISESKIRAIAQQRGRNVDWAVSTVSDAVSASAEDAVKVHAVDGVAATLDDVLAFANGRTVTVAGRQVTLALAGATARDLSMNPFQAFLHLLSNPDIAAVLLTIGSLGLVYEVINPNFVTGIIGALMLILAFIGSQSLPLNVGGLLLIGLAMLLFVLEVTVVSHGMLTVGGLVCLVLGLSALYSAPTSPTSPDVSVALPLIVTMTVTIGAFMAIALLTVVRSRRNRRAFAGGPHLVGPHGDVRVPVGTPGRVRMPLAPLGSVYAAGEEWSARTSDDVVLERGTPVRVVGEDGLTLIVEPAEPARAGS